MKNTKMTWHSTILGHEMPVLVIIWLNVRLTLWMTKCQDGLTLYYSWPPVASTGGTSTECQANPKDAQMSRWPDIVPFLAMRCLYWGYLIKCQPDPLDDQMSRCPDIVLFLVTSCLYRGVHLTECQPDPKDEQMSRWPDLVPFLAWDVPTRGVNISLTHPMTKYQNDLM